MLIFGCSHLVSGFLIINVKNNLSVNFFRCRLTLKNFETRFLSSRKSCCVCDDNSSDGPLTFNDNSNNRQMTVRQLAPTFHNDLKPNYTFDHSYDYVVAKLNFEQVFSFPLTKYSWDLKSNHSTSRNIRNLDFLKIRFQIVQLIKL